MDFFTSLKPSWKWWFFLLYHFQSGGERMSNRALRKLQAEGGPGRRKEGVGEGSAEEEEVHIVGRTGGGFNAFQLVSFN
jgi:hypothetical protein